MKCPKCESSSISVQLVRNGWGPVQGEPVFACHTCGKRLYGKEAVEGEYRRQHKLWTTIQKDTPAPVPEYLTERTRRKQAAEAALRYTARHKQTIRELCVEMEQRLEEALKVRGRLEAMGTSHRESTFSRLRNLADLDVTILERLAREVRDWAEKAEAANVSPDVNRSLKEVQSRLVEIRKVADNLPNRERLAVEAMPSRGLPKRVVDAPEPHPTADVRDVCEWKDCDNFATPNSRYCSVSCKNKNARHRYKLRKQAVKKPSPAPSAPSAPPLETTREVVQARVEGSSQKAGHSGHPPRLIVTTPKPWEGFAALNEDELWRQNLSNLRKYARHELNIVGASKLPGGKPTLVAEILKARRQNRQTA
jgi:hypothetical protein